jgi:periplasmic divalent cation tolerance protein
MQPFLQVTTTADSAALAERIADTLVSERLAACAQVVGPIRSTYRWRGQVERADEWYCHLKTTADRWDAVLARIHALHSYETPEIIAVPIVAGAAPYLAWVAQEVAP